MLSDHISDNFFTLLGSLHACLLNRFICVQLFVTLWTTACQVTLSMRFSCQYWSGLPCPPPGDIPDPGIEPTSPLLQGILTTEPPVNHHYIPYWHEIPSNCQYLIPVFLVMVNIHLFSIRGTCFWKSLGGFCSLYHEGDTVYFLSVLFSCVDGVRKIPTIGEIWFRKKHDRRLRHQSEKKEPRAQSLCIGYKLGTGGTIPVLYTVNT